MSLEEEPPNLYVTGTAAPNFEARPTGLGAQSVAYSVLRPPAAGDSRQYVAASPARPNARTQINPSLVLPAGFKVLAEEGFNEYGIPRRLQCELDGAILAWVPPGAFLQGHDGGPQEAAPAHPVALDGYYISVLEVTLEQYAKFRAANLTTRRPAQPANQFDPPNYPAVGVTWRDAANYARWVGMDLPTEAEWEKAARGEQGFEFPWGNERAIWSTDRRPGQIEPVGSHPTDRSVYGVLDMAGNAREWCSDWYAPDSYLQVRTPDGSPPRNPTGVEKAAPPNSRVIKGAGSKGWQVWNREGAPMRDAVPNVGFRCVLRIQHPEAETVNGGQP